MIKRLVRGSSVPYPHVSVIHADSIVRGKSTHRIFEVTVGTLELIQVREDDRGLADVRPYGPLGIRETLKEFLLDECKSGSYVV